MLNALVLSPIFLLAAYISSVQKTPATAITVFFLALLVQAILGQLAAAGITYAVYQNMRGNDPTLIDCLQVGLSRFGPVLVVAFVSVVAEAVGLMLCIAPGVMIALRLAVVVPVVVEERLGLFDTMRRSTFLTEHYRGQVFGVLFVVGIIQQVLIRIAILPAKDLGTLLMISGGVNILTTGLVSTAAAVSYYRLRSVKESIDVDQISSVFA
jgi:hypothetical protein